MTERKTRPRPPIVTAPLSITQLNCLPLTGIDPRRFLEFTATHRVPRTRIGKLVCVDAEDFRRAIHQHGVVDAHDDRPAFVREERQPETVDEVLALIGRRRA
jgi:hypothetical protein